MHVQKRMLLAAVLLSFLFIIPSGISQTQKAPGKIPSKIMASATVPNPPTWIYCKPSGDGIYIEWADDGDGGSSITSDVVYRGTTSGGEVSVHSVNPVYGYWTDTGTSVGTIYYYYVKAVNAIGSSSPSPEYKVRCVHQDSGVVSTVISYGAGYSGGPPPQILPSTPITLTPSGGTPPYQTIYEYAPYNPGPGSVSQWLNYTSPVTMASAVTDVLYAFNFCSMDSTWHNESLKKVPIYLVSSPPSLPSWITVTPGVGQNYIQWNYTGIEMDNISIWRGIYPGGSNYKLIFDATGNEVYMDVNLHAGTTYYYVLAVANAAGSSGNSSVYSGTPTGGKPSAPYYPTLYVHQHYLHLTWYAIQSGVLLPNGTPASNDGGYPITNYEIYLGTKSGNEVFLTEIGNVTDFDYKLRNDFNYSCYFEVAGKNSAGTGDKSFEANTSLDTLPSLISTLKSVSDSVLVSDVLNFNNATVNASYFLWNCLNEFATNLGVNASTNQLYTDLDATLGNFQDGIWFTYGTFDIKVFVDDALSGKIGNDSAAIALLYELEQGSGLYDLPFTFAMPQNVTTTIRGNSVPGNKSNLRASAATYEMMEGSTGNIITWSVSNNVSASVKTWYLYVSGVYKSSGTWLSGQNLTTNIDNLTVGYWNVTLEVTDYAYNLTTSTWYASVMVTVIPSLSSVEYQIIVFVVVVVIIVVVVVLALRYVKKNWGKLLQ